MWARVVEVMLALWLAISCLIFGYREPMLIFHDQVVALCILNFSILSYLKSCRKLHLMNAAVGCWLIFFAYHTDVVYMQQNCMTLAILLLMLSIIPSPSEKPPYQWMEYMLKKYK